jgi:hypothetical protein
MPPAEASADEAGTVKLWDGMPLASTPGPDRA